jgi:hypothetical protein
VAWLKAVVDTGFDGVNVEVARTKGAKEGLAAEPVMQVFNFGAPVRHKRVFDARAGGPSTQPRAIRKRTGGNLKVPPSAAARSVGRRRWSTRRQLRQFPASLPQSGCRLCATGRQSCARQRAMVE